MPAASVPPPPTPTAPLIPLTPQLAIELARRPASTLSTGPNWLLMGLSVLFMGGLGTSAAMFHEPLLAAMTELIPQSGRATIDAGTVVIDGATIEVQSFLIDRTETRAATLTACVAARACEALPHAIGENLPAIGLTLTQAKALCAFGGGRLPTRAEWHLAAGPGKLPWGDAPPTCNRGIALGCGDEVKPVGSALGGATHRGVLDMAGNAWEWVLDGDDAKLIGGGIKSPASKLGKSALQTPPEGGTHPLAGVRCVVEHAP
jgi:hypothetical protein